MKFDHGFVGRAALEAMARQPQRRKVTLVWNKDDVATIQRSLLQPGVSFKCLEMPVASYGFPQADEVLDASGNRVGMSGFCGYSGNEMELLSLAVLDDAHRDRKSVV